MNPIEASRGRSILLNLNNARIRYNQLQQSGHGDLADAWRQVERTQTLWREHLRRCTAPARVTFVQAA